MAKISIESEDLAKLITVQITGALSVIAGRQLTPGDIIGIKRAVQVDLENGGYLKAAGTYDHIVYRVLN